ncbi:MAG: endonuclease domain-containing protein [Thermoanaerobaculia bacterium]
MQERKLRMARSRARSLRAELTPAEREMWGVLRDRRLSGIKFRRQSPLSIYIADFYCAELKLVVELDGEVHADPKQAAWDQNRDVYLRSIGCTILRFSNDELFHQREAVLNRILETATDLRLRHSDSPSPRSGEGARG